MPWMNGRDVNPGTEHPDLLKQQSLHARARYGTSTR